MSGVLATHTWRGVQGELCRAMCAGRGVQGEVYMTKCAGRGVQGELYRASCAKPASAGRECRQLPQNITTDPNVFADRSKNVGLLRRRTLALPELHPISCASAPKSKGFNLEGRTACKPKWFLGVPCEQDCKTWGWRDNKLTLVQKHALDQSFPTNRNQDVKEPPQT